MWVGGEQTLLFRHLRQSNGGSDPLGRQPGSTFSNLQLVQVVKPTIGWAWGRSARVRLRQGRDIWDGKSPGLFLVL